MEAERSSPRAQPLPPPTIVQRTVKVARKTWREQIHGTWQRIRPIALLGLAVVTLTLGTIGYLQLTNVSRRYGFFDAFYRALTLFGFGGAANPPVPVTLQIARILAPVLVGYAAIGALLALSREQARVLGIRLFVRRHVIIAGLGTTGSRLALALVGHEPVVVIESDPTNERQSAAALRGVRLLIGEAADSVMLRRAGIKHARALVVCCGSDGTNIDVAAAAADLLSGRRYPLTVFVHLDDYGLWSSLAAEGATFAAGRSGMRVEYFNIFVTGAQLLLEQYPPVPLDRSGPNEHHILIVGLEGAGEQLVLQIARQLTALPHRQREKVRVTLAGPGASEELVRLRGRYPALDYYLHLDARAMTVESEEFQRGSVMLGADGSCDVTRAYVSLTDEGTALLAALALHSRPDTARVPVTVAVADGDAGIAIVLASNEGRLSGIESFGVLSGATSTELLLRGTNELLARAKHAEWMRHEQSKGITAQDNPYMRPWEDLNESQREDNRLFADDLHRKLSMIGAMLVPMPLRDPNDKFTFGEEELDRLARDEHDRWVQAKLADGWRPAAERDDTKKVHDQIKPWEELDQENREKDLDAIREIPDMLALAGFRIQRKEPAGGAPSSQDLENGRETQVVKTAG